MERTAVFQRIAKKQEDSFSLAYTYFSIVLSLNNIHVTKRELQFIAFVADGGISSVNRKEEFCRKFKSSPATIGNITSALLERGLIIKEKGKPRVHSQLSLDFEKDVILNINLLHAYG